MPKITRYFQKLFAGGVPASGNLARYGSLAAGSPVYTNDPADIQSLAAFDEGWQTATVANKSPTLQDTNSLQFLMTYQLRSIFQDGVPEWNAETTYYIGGWAKHATTGMAYISLTDDNLNNALADTNNWQSLVEYLRPSIAPENRMVKAWGNIDGGGGSGAQPIRRSYNLASCVRNVNGNYRLTWTTPMATGTYSIQVTAGGDGGPASNRLAYINTLTTTYADIYVTNGEGSFLNTNILCFQVFE